jgi:enediyne biosynthesis protein E4
MGAGVGDYDGDGWLDIVRTNFSEQVTTLYRNYGGAFEVTSIRAGLGVNRKHVGFGVDFFDFDNDGWSDIFIANGHVYSQIANRKLHLTYREPKIVYRNLGSGRFEDVSAKVGEAIRAENLGRGCAFGDFDNDGDVDVIINNLDGPPTLLRNDGGSNNNWILIKCVGTRSNRSAIGTRVKVTTAGHSQIDEVMSGSSYYSQNDLRLHFGLGRATRVDTVELAWPSGVKETFRDLAANQLFVIQESKGIVSGRKAG